MLEDNYYPTIDLAFIEELINSSDRVAKIITIGNTKAYVLSGTGQLHRRIFYFQIVGDGQVSFNFATGVATKLKCMGQLLKWLEENRGWKEGAYIQFSDN